MHPVELRSIILQRWLSKRDFVVILTNWPQVCRAAFVWLRAIKRMWSFDTLAIVARFNEDEEENGVAVEGPWR